MTNKGTSARVGEQVPASVDGAPAVESSGELSAEELAGFAAWEAELCTELGDPEGPGDWELVAEVDEVLAGSGAQGWVDPAQELMGGLAAAARGLERAAQDQQDLVRVFDAGVEQALEAAGRVRSQLMGVTVAVVFQAWDRGLHSAVGLNLVNWVRQRCPWVCKEEACQIQDVVRAGDTHWGKPLLAAVVDGATGVHRAAKVARTMRRLVGSLSVEGAQEYAGIATRAAMNPGLSDAELDVVCKRLLIDLLDEKPKDEAKETQQGLRCVTRRPLGRGMTRYTVDAPEGDAPLFDSVLTGPLAAPVKDENGHVDMRSPGQRKYDALLMVVNRGLSNPGAPPSSGRASVMVTVKADPQTGKPQGAAVVNTGQVLDAAQAGRLACLGDVTPIALGEYGEPLNLGRTVRLATPGQFKSLVVRDSHCSYPGCDVDPTWCDVHHLVWWCRGGGTDIAFLVLLCPRHHTLVHDKDLMATVAGSVVTWHV